MVILYNILHWINIGKMHSAHMDRNRWAFPQRKLKHKNDKINSSNAKQNVLLTTLSAIYSWRSISNVSCVHKFVLFSTNTIFIQCVYYHCVWFIEADLFKWIQKFWFGFLLALDNNKPEWTLSPCNSANGFELPSIGFSFEWCDFHELKSEIESIGIDLWRETFFFFSFN